MRVDVLADDDLDLPQTRAALYVRMSTENQNYSTDHQRATIQEYATRMGMRLVREYADEGKSGLGMKGRAGLSQLIHDVHSGQADYSVIVVYDVSRWGRFQDIDEAAYHEHTCRRAGIRVDYCAEQFLNDGSPFGALLKSIKRTMAAEYSRDLSAKVFNAQCRFISLGFKQGGSAGYGFRRVAITDAGVVRGILAHLDRKTKVTDRVVLVAGPKEEIALVRRIYALYLDNGMSDASIARLLNVEQIQNEFGTRWTRALVNTILTNRKYDGALVFNRKSCKLSSARTSNSTDAWIINEGAIEKILPPEIYGRAQIERAHRAQSFDPIDLLRTLRSCYQRHGRITAKIIVSDPSVPTPQTFARYFGSLAKAYEIAGITNVSPHPFVETKRRIKAFRESMFADAGVLIRTSGKIIQEAPHLKILTIDGSVRVRVETATCRRADRGIPYWQIFPFPDVDFTLIARFDFKNQTVLDYLLIPARVLSRGAIYLRLKTPLPADCMQFASLDAAFGAQPA